MYKVEKFEVADQLILHSVIERFPFATVITANESEHFINHLPITPEINSEGQVRLLGHMSKRNPQWHHMKSGASTVIAFQGPHAYINPIWYQENDVPTWNYIVVQASGRGRVVEDHGEIVEILQKSTDHMNRIHPDQWEFEIPWDLRSKEDLTSAIVGFELIPEKLVGKFKLNQNRSLEDQKGVIEGLGGRADQGSQMVAQWMAQLIES